MKKNIKENDKENIKEYNFEKEELCENSVSKNILLKKNRRVRLYSIIIFFTVMVFLYFIASLYFEKHYFFGTSIDGINCSCITPTKAKQLIINQLDDYNLTITGRKNLSATIQDTDIDLKYTLDSSFDNIIKQQTAYKWIIGLFAKQDYETTEEATFSETKLENLVQSMPFFLSENITEPVNAYISAYDSSTNSYSIIPEEEGTDIISNTVLEKVVQAIEAHCESLDLDVAGCYQEPEILSDNAALISALSTVNKYVQATITYDWNSHSEVVDGSLISEWIKIDGTNVSLDEDSISDWIAECAYLYDTYGKTRSFTTVSGVVKELPSGGYGWSTNRSAELEQLEENIEAGEEVSRQPIYLYTAAQEGDNDIGDSYVEVDLTGQHVYLVIDGEVIYDTDCVSGNVSNGNGTPEGVFGITYKERNATLVGETYSTPVNYWMPFNGNIGLHDATWRSTFGGDIYLTSGSHGCINLPLEAAETIYGYVETGFPVVCYY